MKNTKHYNEATLEVQTMLARSQNSLDSMRGIIKKRDLEREALRANKRSNQTSAWSV